MNFFRTAIILFFAVFACANLTAAQNFPAPRQEKLLNGLKMLIWSDVQNQKATVKLRIHSGAAFDPKDKMGTMALVGDLLFPSEQTKDFFAEDLEGGLKVETNYDYIQITATGKAEEIQTILETIANAVTNPQITPENVKTVRDARLEKVKELEKNPSYIADRAVAKRLFGDFPYGRSADGTAESIAKIDRPDLMLAYDRFFTADNATLTVSGNVNGDAVYRVSRQLFGAWKKAETKVPATFRLPDAPDTTELTVAVPDTERINARLATIAVSRNSKDFYAAQTLSFIWQGAFCLTDDSSGKLDYQPYLLRGIYEVRKSYQPNTTTTISDGGKCRNVWLSNGKFANAPFTDNEFQSAKTYAVGNFQQKTNSLSDLADLWLDVDTYKLVSVKDEMSKLNSVTFADVQRVNNDLQNQPMVKVIVKNSGIAKQ